MQSNDQILPDPSIGMEIPVELEDHPDSFLHIFGDGKETEIIRRNQALSQKMGSQKFCPAFPIGSADFIDQDHRDNSALCRSASGSDTQTLHPSFQSRPETGRWRGFL